MSRKTRSIDFEIALKELEEIVEKMENGELTLEESLKHFERGIELTRTCQQALHEAEQKVQILLEKNKQYEVVDIEEDI
ncbi:MAG: exodeoxyribonuclease VII small subunit [Gammaproteobacteria bacterium RBG_16_57_12]|nr:MAG: exodeoxyribonuclease VII small subunit [Gammaproteobacteria bacterium RBG_16_57_12]